MAAPGSAMAFDGFGVWQQDGKVVLYANNGRLPNRCVACNGPAQHKVTRTFFWHAPWIYVLILGVLVYAIVAFLVHKTATVEYWLCDKHRKKRTLSLVLAGVAPLVCFILMLVAIAVDSPAFVIVCVVGMIVLPVVAGLEARMVRPTRIDDVEIWLKAGAPFVASLPTSPRMGVVGYGESQGGVMNQGYGPPPPRW
jgi:hypothetical protein